MELTTARTALEEARQSEAETYAFTEFSAAVDSLEAAESSISQEGSKFALFRNYSRAKTLLAEAESLSVDAREAAVQQKERVRTESMQLLTSAEAGIEEAKRLVEVAPVGKGSRAEIELIKADIASLAPALEEAKAAYERGDYVTAIARAKVILSKTDELAAEIRAAQGLVGAPGAKTTG